MKAIACAIVIHALIFERTRFTSTPTDVQLLSMAMLMGYFLFYGG